MRDIGIDIRNHSPQRLTKDLCTAANIIISMDQGVSKKVLQVHDRATSHMECWDIPDPADLQVDTVQVRDAIGERVADLVQRLDL
jgi:protein-tyrosine-phosphatase